MFTATVLGTIFAGFLGLGGIISWLLFNERRLATLTEKVATLEGKVATFERCRRGY